MKQLKYRENLNKEFKHCSDNLLIYEGYSVNGNKINIFWTGKMATIEYINDNIVSIFISDIFGKQSVTNAIILKGMKIDLEIKTTKNEIIIIGKKIKTCIDKKTCEIVFIDRDDNIICRDYQPSFKDKDGCVYISKVNDCPAYYGLGEKGGPLNKLGYYTENFNTDDPETDDNSTVYYKTIPFYIALNKYKTYGILFDNSFRSFFDMGKSHEDIIFFGAEGGNIQYYFIMEENIKEVLREYSNLTGRMDMPPLWSLGYQQTRFSYFTQDEVLDIMNKFKEKEIPIDTIYLDINYMDGFRVMTFKKPEFENAKELIRTLKDNGIKTVVILDPGVKVDENYGIYVRGIEGDHFVKNEDGSIFVGDVWPNSSAFPDFSNENARNWWKGELKYFINKYDIDGIWNDMNEPCVFNNEFKTMPYECIHNGDHGIIKHQEFHNRYGLEMSRCSNEAQKELRPNTREFSMTRATYAGGQRYSSIWTGDNSSLWSQLRMSLPMNMNLGMSGFSFLANDVGGFSLDCTEELFIRWMQVGAFLPIFRNHSNMHTKRQEPWEFGERAEKISKNIIELRYKLIPYLYTTFYDSHKIGIPVFRPLVMEYQNDENVFDISDEFMLGSCMLIAPVINEGQRERDVYLPEGIWYNYFTNEKYDGNHTYTLKCDINEVLLFIKSGSVIPTYDEKYMNMESRPQKVTFKIYGNKAEGRYYYDDGKTYDYKKGVYNLKIIKSDGENIHEEFIHNGLDKKEEESYVFIK